MGKGNKKKNMSRKANNQRKTALGLLLKAEKEEQTKGNGGGFNFLNGNSLTLNLKKRQRMMQRRAITKRKVPVAVGYKQSTVQPLIVTSLKKTLVKHTEYVTDVDGSGQLEGEAFVINPGNGMLFPWLSTIAQRFQSYKFKSLQFRYVTTAPTTSGGSVILLVDYDSSAETLPASKVEALAMESSVRTQPWDCITHVSQAHNLNKRSSYYIRNGTSDVVDSELYDVGTFMVMVEGLPTEFVGGSIGEIHVDYEVELVTPILTNSTSAVTGAVAYTTGNVVSGSGLTQPYFQFNDNIQPADAPFSQDPADLLVMNWLDGIEVGGTTTGLAISFEQPGTYMVDLFVFPEYGAGAATEFHVYNSSYKDECQARAFEGSFSDNPISGQSPLTPTLYSKFFVLAPKPGARFACGFSQAGLTGFVSGTSAIYISPWSDSTGMPTGGFPFASRVTKMRRAIRTIKRSHARDVLASKEKDHKDAKLPRTVKAPDDEDRCPHSAPRDETHGLPPSPFSINDLLSRIEELTLRINNGAGDRRKSLDK